MTKDNLRRRADAGKHVRDAGTGKPQRDRSVSIGDLSREFGVTLRALRFYEDRGLLVPRRKGTARIYSARARTRLATILKGKRLGFTLGEIRGMIAGEEGAQDHDGNLRLSLDQVEQQIAHLERQKIGLIAAIAELHSTRDRLVARLAAE